MEFRRTLFDVIPSGEEAAPEPEDLPPAPKSDAPKSDAKKEATPLERLRNLEDKISDAVGKVKTLKEEKKALDEKVRALESLLSQKDGEIEKLRNEKSAIKDQIDGLLTELDSIQIG